MKHPGKPIWQDTHRSAPSVLAEVHTCITAVVLAGWWGLSAPVIVVNAKATTQVQELEVIKTLAADLLDVLHHLGGSIPEQAHLRTTQST